VKESENNALVSVYPHYFFDPFDDKPPQEKTTRTFWKKKTSRRTFPKIKQLGASLWGKKQVGAKKQTP